MQSHELSPVTTVVISHNRRAQVLRSLPNHTSPVIFVDNGSTDGTADAVSRAYPYIRLVRLTRNRGAVARNIGVALAATRYVGFADDDSWWAPGALRRAARILDRHPEVALLAARILVGDERREDPLCRILARSPLPARDGLPGTPVLGFASCGAVIRRTAFLEAGGFDPVVFFPGEENRLALDLATAGWDLCYTPELVAYHHPSPGRDPAMRRMLIMRNALLTAVMRRPWQVTVETAWRALGSGRDGVRGVLAAFPRLPAAVLARSPVPHRVEARMRLVELWGSGAGGPAA